MFSQCFLVRTFSPDTQHHPLPRAPMLLSRGTCSPSLQTQLLSGQWSPSFSENLKCKEILNDQTFRFLAHTILSPTPWIFLCGDVCYSCEFLILFMHRDIIAEETSVKPVYFIILHITIFILITDLLNLSQGFYCHRYNKRSRRDIRFS